MARFRKLESRLYNDALFRSLSPPQPSAQYLLIYLLTGPFSTSIPGLISAGEAALAEALDWSAAEFRAAFKELVETGMATADWKSRVIWLPIALGANKPESPNVTRGWAKHIDELPDCELRSIAVTALREAAASVGTKFIEAFDDAMSKPAAAPIQRPVTATTEEEVAKSQKLPAALLEIWDLAPQIARSRSSQADCLAIWRKLGLSSRADEIKRGIESWISSADWQKKDGEFIPGLHRFLKSGRWQNPPPGDESTSHYRDPTEQEARDKGLADGVIAGFNPLDEEFPPLVPP